MRSLSVVLVVVVSFSSSAAEEKPNVLFIASDDLNCDLGCYGHPLVKSPNLDRLAKRSLLFENAYCQYPVCNPSRASFMTGLYPTQTKVLSNGPHFRKFHPKIVTMPQHFQKHGYFTARVGKIYHFGVPGQIGTPGLDDAPSWHKTVNPKGVDKDVEGKIHTLQKGRFGGTLSWLSVDSKDEQHTDGLGATAAIKLLEDHHPRKTGKPFFLAVGFYRPHTPYVAPEHYFKLYPREKIRPAMMKPGERDDVPLAALADRPKQLTLTLETRKEIIQAYYASTTLMDACVGRVLDTLKRLGLDKNTIIVFVSDHGYHLGQHGLWQKGDLFEGSCRVPLMISVPGMKTAGQKTKALTEMTDFYPTLSELCGLAKPGHVSGRSLVSVLKDPSKQVREAALTVAWSRSPSFRKKHKGKRVLGYSLRTARYRYTSWGEFGEELYDYQQDPGELVNLARKPGGKALLEKMRAMMKKTRTRVK